MSIYKIEGKIFLNNVNVCMQYNTNIPTQTNNSIGKTDLLEIDVVYDIKVCLSNDKYIFTISGEEIDVKEEGISNIVKGVLCGMNNLFKEIYKYDQSNDCCIGGCENAEQIEDLPITGCDISNLSTDFLSKCETNPPSCELEKEITKSLTKKISQSLQNLMTNMIKNTNNNGLNIPSSINSNILVKNTNIIFNDFLQINGNFSLQKPIDWILKIVNKLVPTKYNQEINKMKDKLTPMLKKALPDSNPKITVINSDKSSFLNINPDLHKVLYHLDESHTIDFNCKNVKIQ